MDRHRYAYHAVRLAADIGLFALAVIGYFALVAAIGPMLGVSDAVGAFFFGFFAWPVVTSGVPKQFGYHTADRLVGRPGD